jgi:hypothetical protein
MKKIIFLLLILGNLFIKAAEKTEMIYYSHPKWEEYHKFFYPEEVLNPEDFENTNSQETLLFHIFCASKLYPCYKAFVRLNEETRVALIQELEKRTLFIINLNKEDQANIFKVYSSNFKNSSLANGLQIRILKYIEAVAVKLSENTVKPYKVFRHIFNKALIDLITIEHNFTDFVSLRSKL